MGAAGRYGGEAMIIAIDGPSGSGKSTVARLVAERLGWLHLDSGALYRALTLAALQRGARMDDPEALLSVAMTSRVELRPAEGEEPRVVLDGADVTGAIRTPQVTAHVGALADVPAVRARVTALVRQLAQGRDVVADGRDATTVIFPEADLKVFLDAAPEERARRRFEELVRRGTPVAYDEVLAAILERDRRDRERAVGALRRAPDALVLDTTGLGLAEVVERVVCAADAIRARRAARAEHGGSASEEGR
ncbi:MAG: cytidylate kinase [Planctomycetota bacterium]|nr:MAG: cytidylate kinase [Planctomycetota bacterium]